MARGGRQPGAGRPKGAVNKATADIKAIAQEHGPAAIAKLVHLMENAQSEQTQRAAAADLLDRGYGKPAQAIVGDDEKPIRVVTRIELVAATQDDAS